jgi:hypothetical protein
VSVAGHWLAEPKGESEAGVENTGGSGAANNNAVIIHACTIEEA